jgi:hypothetical protein
MRVLALCSYPLEAAATRFRLLQLAPALAREGIELETVPFLDAAGFAQLYDRAAWPNTARRLVAAGLRRIRDTAKARSADVLLVQREAMLFGPPLVEWMSTTAGGPPLVLDLDDATYVSYRSLT